jgi:hypothetical protein
MDTKTLHDNALDNGIDLANSPEYHDCIEPWVKLLLSTPEYLIDVLPDIIADALEEEDKTHRPAQLSRDLEITRSDMQMMEKHVKSGQDYTGDDLFLTYTTSISMHLSNIGQFFSLIILAGAQKHVEDNAEQWMEEVAGYYGDMMVEEEQMKGDFLYEQEKDRRQGL